MPRVFFFLVLHVLQDFHLNTEHLEWNSQDQGAYLPIPHNLHRKDVFKRNVQHLHQKELHVTLIASQIHLYDYLDYLNSLL